MGDNNAQSTNVVDKNQILQALMLNMARQRAGQNSMSGIPGAAQPSPAMPQNAATQGPSQQGGMPGAAPSPQPQSQPGAPARQLSPASPTPFNGTFGDRKGIISQLVNSAEKRTHDKKVNEAEMYYNQINSFLASGQPGDQQKAQQLLDDPKIRKILKTGLDYVPLEEDVPPEAIGIHQAQQKIDKKQSTLQQLKQMLSGGRQQGNAQPRPQGKAVIPGPSQEAQGKYAEQQAKIDTEKAHGGSYQAEAEKFKSEADAATVKAEADRIKAQADSDKAKADAEEARSHAKLYDKQAKEAEDLSPGKSKELQAHANEMNAAARWHDAQAKYLKNGGKVPGSALQSQIKSARTDAVTLLKGYISDNKDAAKAVSKDTGYVFGPKAGLVKAQDDAAKKAKDLTKAIAWFDGEGTQAVTDGKMTLMDSVRKMYQMAGIDAPVPGTGDAPATTSTDDEIMKLIGQ